MSDTTISIISVVAFVVAYGASFIAMQFMFGENGWWPLRGKRRY
jgi:hypothetical protein